MVDEDKAKLQSFEEHVRFHKEKVAEQRKQLADKDVSTSENPECDVGLKKDLANTTADVRYFTTQHTADKGVLDGIHTALALQKTASQQRYSARTRDC